MVKKKRKTKKKNSSFFISSHTIVIASSLIVSVFLFFFVVPLLWHSETQCANSISCIKDLSGKFEEGQNIGEFMGRAVVAPKQEFREDIYTPSVLGNNTAPKKIVIDLTNQHLYAYEGNSKVYDFLVSTGKWYPTPTGTFNIWIKLRSTRMTGGNPAWGTFYDLPNVQYTMYFYNKKILKTQGFAIHGAYWHNNFGHPMSHGCVNMRNQDAELLYNWTKPQTGGFTTYASDQNPGTEVDIIGDTPKT